MISAGAGLDESLNKIREDFMNEHATKADFEEASKDEMKSEQREAAEVARNWALPV